MMMSESVRLVTIGIALGLAAVLWAGRLVQTLVYGLSPSDPLTIGAAAALIAATTALAGAARRERESHRGLAAAVGVAVYVTPPRRSGG